MSNLSDTKTFSSFTMMWVMHMPTEIIKELEFQGRSPIR